MNAIEDIAAERQRQIEAEGWTPEHDDEHERGELAKAGATYALYAGTPSEWSDPMLPSCWPWGRAWLKAGDRRRDLVKAGALIVAEIERLDRQQPVSEQEGE